MIGVVKKLVRRILNLFFRGNNLLLAEIKAHIKGNTLQIGSSTNLKNVKIVLSGEGNYIQIGEQCSLSGVVIYMNCNNNKLIIGNNVRVNATEQSPTCFNACDGSAIVIEDDCLFSNSIEIHTTDYHKIYVNNQRYNSSESVHIGKHTWVGLRTLILKGVCLSDNTIVGANSVVANSNDESSVIIAGSPAKVIKRNISWDY